MDKEAEKMEELYNVFISYRTDPVGQLISQRLADDLKSLGYSVYHNSDRNHKGRFDERLQKMIEGCQDFLLILSEECLKKLLRSEPVDWVREELFWALSHNKNIIPVYVEGTVLPEDKTKIPDNLRFLDTIESVTLPPEYNKPTPIQFLVGKFNSRKGSISRAHSIYNDNKNFRIDDLFNKTKRMAESGNRKAMYDLASFYYYGYGDAGQSDRNYDKAFPILLELSKGNDIYASYADTLLARLYYDGLAPGEPQSYEKSFQYHSLAAPVCNYSAAQYAFMLSIGSGCRYDFDQAEQAYRTTTRNGDNIATEGLARLYMSVGKYKEAANIYCSMSSFIQDSEYQLGMLYKRGVLSDPPQPDYFRAAFYFHHAIDSKKCGAEVYHQLACLYFNPTGGFPKDFRSAQKYFSIAADMDHTESQYMLAFMYECGHVTKDIDKAIELYTKAADRGHYLSAVQLAFLYQQKEHIRYDKAYYYAKSAAENGVMEGEFVFGVLLLLGRGCQPDINNAVRYLKLALKHGIYQAKFFLDNIAGVSREYDENGEKKSYYHFKGSFTVNNKFVGRRKELAQLADIMKQHRVCFVCGCGGIGKTELVREYASENKKQYDNILFIRYSSSLTDLIISDHYFEINGFTRMMINNEPEPDEMFCRRKLQSIKELLPENSLIVLDGFDTEYDPMLDEFLNGSYKVIITTRMNSDTFGFPVLKINEMDNDELKEIFYKSAGIKRNETDTAVVDDIVSYLGRNTLYVELAAGLISSKKMTADMLLKSIKETETDKLREPGRDVLRLFEVEDPEDAAKNILYALSLLPSSGVSFESFIKWCGLPDGNIINILIQHNWIQYDAKNDNILLNTSVSEAIDGKLISYSKSAATMIMNLSKDFRSAWNIDYKSRIYLGEIAKSLYKKINISKETISAFRAILRLFLYLGYYSLCDRLFNIIRDYLGQEASIELAWFCFDYGEYLLDLVKYDQALEYNQKAIYMLEGICPPNPYDLAYLYKQKGNIYHKKFDQSKNSEMLTTAYQALLHSKELFEQSLSDQSTQWGSSYYSYALDLKNEHTHEKASLLYHLGVNRYYAEDYKKAEAFSEQALDLFKSIADGFSDDITAPMIVLSMIYAKTGRNNSAVETEKEVIKIKGQVWGSNHLRYLEQFEVLSDICQKTKQTEEAIRVLRRLEELIVDNPMYADYLKTIRNKISALDRLL